MKPIPLPKSTDRVPVVVLADGIYPEAEPAVSILAAAAKVVCCDGAACVYIGRGGRPYAIVGDCDSLPDDFKREYASILHCDHDQETNDLTKAVRFCIADGERDIVILGATGKREDHTLGNIGLLGDYRKLVNVRMVTDLGVFDPVCGDCRFESFPGQQVSVFCADPSVRVTTVGLQFPLHEANLTTWWQGTLNESLSDCCGFDLSGPAVVYRTFVPKK